MGTRFLASQKAEVAEGYKAAVLAASSKDTVRAAFVNDLVPPAAEGAYDTAPRVLRNAFVAEWEGRPDAVREQRDALVQRVRQAVQDGP